MSLTSDQGIPSSPLPATPTAFPVPVPAERFSPLEIRNAVLALEHRSRFLRGFLASINSQLRKQEAAADLQATESIRAKLTQP